MMSPRRDHAGPSTTAVGRLAESAACQHLQRRGLDILARNELAGGAELDIVAREQLPGGEPTCVFVEVRARRSVACGHPLETIDRRKCRRLVHGARSWLLAHDLWERVEVRFDVCAVLLGDPPRVEWFKGAFDGDPA
ncbi:MAG: YraN family protein [Myxococcales bacterium FL481]|nr:MAG: YraN family protein [Myxococcales bacterium FL481]